MRASVIFSGFLLFWSCALDLPEWPFNLGAWRSAISKQVL